MINVWRKIAREKVKRLGLEQVFGKVRRHVRTENWAY